MTPCSHKEKGHRFFKELSTISTGFSTAEKPFDFNGFRLFSEKIIKLGNEYVKVQNTRFGLHNADPEEKTEFHFLA